MKKISAKIVVLSLANTLVITLLNTIATMVMRNSGPAAASTVGQGQASHQPSGAMFLMPTSVWISTLASFVIGAIASYFLGRYISKPILTITKITKDTSNFDLENDKAFGKTTRYKDECGAMASALFDTRAALRSMAIKLKSISSSLETHSQSLSNNCSENVNTITQVVNTINHLTEGNNNQVQLVSEINSTLSEVASLIDDITVKTSTGAEKAVQSLETIEDGQRSVEMQAKKMEETIAVTIETNKSIEDLEKMISEVGSIVDVITSIAGQTNLLALNAAIEAARAGESGKGFAVVAEEIRKLAEESSKSANEIGHIISSTTEKTKLAVENMNTTNELVEEQKKSLGITQESFNRIRASYGTIVDGLKQTAATMKIINEKSRVISTQTQDITAIVQESAASMEEISASGQEQLASIELVADSAKGLFSIAEELSKEVKHFKVG
ncbi:MAG TPA: methyl-accepting chemotaxis protein [Clostridia bacterium]|nr:methyl-accepting chemotaxis protein [Clostridia bacterium]